MAAATKGRKERMKQLQSQGSKIQSKCCPKKGVEDGAAAKVESQKYMAAASEREKDEAAARSGVKDAWQLLLKIGGKVGQLQGQRSKIHGSCCGKLGEG